MSEMKPESFEIPSPDHYTIRGTHWRPQHPARAVIQIFHGLGEHHARYVRFAAAAVARGLSVVAHDHRGHGAEAGELRHLPGKDGWRLLVSDGLKVNDMIGDQYPGVPIILLGHSMGSFIAQSFSILHDYRLTALVLSASSWATPLKIIPGQILARIESWRLGAHGKSALLNKIGFEDFNRQFEPARTELDWLTRDATEVDKYINDPLCGGPYSCDLWRALLGGLRTIGSEKALRQIRAELPILITSGADDPVGGEQGVNDLAMHYTRSGHNRVTARTYSGGRHEMLNETNHLEFTNDVLDWVENQLPGIAPA